MEANKMVGIKDWKILVLENEQYIEGYEFNRVDELIEQLEKFHHIANVYRTFDTSDFFDVYCPTTDLTVILIEYDEKNKEEFKKTISEIRRINAHIPVMLFTRDRTFKNFDLKEFDGINEFFYLESDTINFLSKRIERHVRKYIDILLPPYFGELMKYIEEANYSWGTPQHGGGVGFTKSPIGKMFFDFYGENLFRGDLSNGVPDLGNILDHSEPTGAAERHAAKVFNADLTYFVLNGSSSVNQVVYRGRVTKDDIVYIDRNCHKSLNYGLVVSEGIPTYMVPRRNGLGLVGPVRLNEFNEDNIKNRINDNPLTKNARNKDVIQISTLTNTTYDGVCYNVNTIKKSLSKVVKNIHFDEAWYAFAHFHPLYKNHYAMTDSDEKIEHPPIFATQSTHKLLTAFSQCSMMQAKNGTNEIVDPEVMNESYMMYTSTSPFYPFIAGLDVAAQMMDLDGERLINDGLMDNMNLRRTLAKLHNEAKANDDWFFTAWQPEKVNYHGKEVLFEDADAEYLANSQEVWTFRKEDDWHGFPDIEEDYIMLDPVKITVLTPGLSATGEYSEWGIPSAIVGLYLTEKGVVCEKNDYYSMLFLSNMGETKGKHAALVLELSHFKDDYERNAPMDEVMPHLVEQFPEAYKGKGLKDHCDEMHKRIQELKLREKMDEGFEIIPTPECTPAEAARKVFRNEIKKVPISKMLNETAAVQMVPYPPGIPIIMGGEKIDGKAKPILEYLLARQQFEQEFPGYYAEIHGIDPEIIDGERVFTTMIFK